MSERAETIIEQQGVLLLLPHVICINGIVVLPAYRGGEGLLMACSNIQGRTKPRKAGFENLLHKVPPPYFSWERRSKQLT